MSKQPKISTETQIQINRASWIQALRENGHRQIFGSWNDGHSGVCAGGLALEMCGGSVSRDMNRFLGLPENDTEITGDNCVRGRTFAQIADAALAGRYWSD